MIEIKYKIKSRLGVFETKDFYTNIKGEIYFFEEEIGYIEAERTNADHMFDCNFTLGQVFGLDDSEMQQMSCFFNKEGNWKKSLDKDYDPEEDAFMLKSLYLYSPFRGVGIGTYALRDIIKIFGKQCGYLIGEAKPLQFFNGTTEINGYDKLEQDRKKALKSLLKYYKKLGFKQYEKTSKIYFNLNNIGDFDAILEEFPLVFDELNKRAKKLRAAKEKEST